MNTIKCDIIMILITGKHPFRAKTNILTHQSPTMNNNQHWMNNTNSNTLRCSLFKSNI